MVRQLIQHRLFFAERQHRDAFHLALQHAPHARRKDRRVAVRRAHQDLVAVGHRHFLKALDQLRKERVRDVLHNDAEQPAAPRDKTAGVGVRKVIQLLNRLPNALAQTVAHGGRAVDGARDRGDRNLGQRRYSSNVRRLRNGLAGSFTGHANILKQLPSPAKQSFHGAVGYPARDHRPAPLLRPYLHPARSAPADRAGFGRWAR